MKRKLILFDWGNIVESHSVGYTNIDAWNDLFRRCGYKGDFNVFKLLGKYDLCSPASKEEFEEVFNELHKDFDFNVTYDEFLKIYDEIFDNVGYFKEVALYEKSLKDKAFIGIFSDLTYLDIKRLDRQVGLQNYDYVLLSTDIKLRKNDIKAFEKASVSLPFDKKDILFIDDREENINNAHEFGWNTLKATGLELDKIKKVVDLFLNNDYEHMDFTNI